MGRRERNSAVGPWAGGDEIGSPATLAAGLRVLALGYARYGQSAGLDTTVRSLPLCSGVAAAASDKDSETNDRCV